MKKLYNKKGFTLIEVVLTIAIGALIFLLAFIAFRNAQVNRRDAQRRRDADNIMAQLNNYKADKGGGSILALTAANSDICVASATVDNFAGKYLCTNGEFKSPDGSLYQTIDGGNSTVALTKDQVQISTVWTFYQTYSHTACDGTTPLPTGGFKVRIGLEKGVACRDSL